MQLHMNRMEPWALGNRKQAQAYKPAAARAPASSTKQPPRFARYSSLACRATKVELSQRLLEAVKGRLDAERQLKVERAAFDAKLQLTEAKLKGEADRKVFEAEKGWLEAERRAAEAKLKAEAQQQAFNAAKGRLEAENERLDAESLLEIQALRIRGMSLKGRLHAQGLQEEAEDVLRIKYKKWDMPRTQLYTELADEASKDRLISCMTAGAAAAKKDIGDFAAAMHERLSESAHKTNRTSVMMGEPIIILLDGVLTADECEVLVCMAKLLKIPYECRSLGDNVDLTSGNAKGASSKE